MFMRFVFHNGQKKYIIFLTKEGDVMSIEKEMLDFLAKKESWVFCIKDVLSFGDYFSVAKALGRLTEKGDIQRLTQGIYYYPLINKLFNLSYPPEIKDVVEAIARNNNWDIRETGNSALYFLGLDNQIPMTFTFLSSGPYRTYNIDNRTIEFKSSANKNFIFSRKTSLIVQALKALGENNIGFNEIMKLSNFLSNKDKEELLNNIVFAPLWMQKYLKDIGGLNNE